MPTANSDNQPPNEKPNSLYNAHVQDTVVVAFMPLRSSQFALLLHRLLVLLDLLHMLSVVFFEPCRVFEALVVHGAHRISSLSPHILASVGVLKTRAGDTAA